MSRSKELSQDGQPDALRHDPDFQQLRSLVRQLPDMRKEALMKHLEEKEPLFMSVQEFSQTTGIPVQKVRRWLREGLLKGKKVSRTWLIPREEIDRLKD
jgi:excisionase family DNA binding protein